eukprot:TRINITY_DN49117_c0_g1_i1.p1 TRINITY_DN49117_c0_g1~~TRINITY_DN49117_c0_g1_i1.p1  ORF type:complete len:550 (-),score=27.19 TRINITY_DN49117_c0_g1_i1:119-1768(-)
MYQQYVQPNTSSTDNVSSSTFYHFPSSPPDQTPEQPPGPPNSSRTSPYDQEPIRSPWIARSTTEQSEPPNTTTDSSPWVPLVDTSQQQQPGQAASPHIQQTVYVHSPNVIISPASIQFDMANSPQAQQQDSQVPPPSTPIQYWTAPTTTPVGAPLPPVYSASYNPVGGTGVITSGFPAIVTPYTPPQTPIQPIPMGYVEVHVPPHLLPMDPHGMDSTTYNEVTELFQATGNGRIPTALYKVNVPSHRIQAWNNFREQLPEDHKETQQLWHGTAKDSITSICTSAFRLPDFGGMLGKGCYFALHSEKAARHAEKHANNQVLLCDVLPGSSYRTKTSAEARYACTNEDTIKSVHNSVWAENFVTPELAVYNVDQILPKYMLEFNNPTRTVGIGARPWFPKPQSKKQKFLRGIVRILLFLCTVGIGLVVPLILTFTWLERESWAASNLTEQGVCSILDVDVSCAKTCSCEYRVNVWESEDNRTVVRRHLKGHGSCGKFRPTCWYSRNNQDVDEVRFRGHHRLGAQITTISFYVVGGCLGVCCGALLFLLPNW